MYRNDKHWLEGQPGMRPWPNGCARLDRQIDDWLAEYSTPLCEQVVDAAHPDRPVFAGRVWCCWGYHWHQAADAAGRGKIDGREVAGRIRAGQGYLRGGRLGGNPLRDVVLALAMLHKDNRATGSFQREYFGFLRSLAGKLRACHYRDPDAWWDEFLDFLAGYTKPPGKLEGFEGRCGLQNWLGTVLWNFLRRRAGGPAAVARPLDAEYAGGQPESLDRELLQCVNLFAEVGTQALAELPKPDRLVLCLLFVDGLTLKEAGRILRKHAGNVGKQRDRALERLHRLLLKHAAEYQRQEAFQDCLESFGTASKDFADALFDALKESGQQEDEP